MHELAAFPDDGPGENVEFFQRQSNPTEIALVRCPECKGLREINIRHVTRNSHVCQECRKGNVVPKSRYYNYWIKNFSMEEIREMAKAIWG